MGEKNNYIIEDIYQGGASTFKPYPTKDTFRVGKFGETTDPRNANVLKEVSDKLSSGTKHIEVEMVSPEVFDSIPKQQLEEVKRLAKLTGIDVSVHGPVINTSGLDPRSGYSEAEREIAERKVTNALMRSHEINPDGNIPVNFHSGEGIPGSEWLPSKERKDGREARKLIVVNRESGRLVPLEEEKEFYPGGEVFEKTRTPEKRLESLNSTDWKNSLFQIEVNRENAERIVRDVHPVISARFAAWQSGKLNPEEVSEEERAQMHKVASAFEFIQQAKQSADALFSRAYEYAKKDNDKDKIKALNEMSVNYGKLVGIEKGDVVDKVKYLDPKLHAQAIFGLTQGLEQVTPKSYVKVEDFALEKSSQTYGNAAFEAFKKFKDNAPTLVIENPPAGFVLSRGEDIKNIVVESRKQFVKKAVESGKFSEGEAEKAASKLIGATWDVGHINMMRKYGYSEKDIIKETERVAPYVKHVHLSDNFGFEHTELPMGMGNVPLKQMMEKLGKKGEDATKIIEAGQWWQHFRTSPFAYTLKGMGSPIYNTGVAPYWNQAVGMQQDYFGGMGLMLPQINYETFGAGFSQLPGELGGQKQSAQGSRMSGRGME